MAQSHSRGAREFSAFRRSSPLCTLPNSLECDARHGGSVKRTFLQYLPEDTQLEAVSEANGEIEEGRLVGEFGSASIVRGIPRFAPGGTYAHSFGLQWNRYRETQLDSRNGQYRSHDDFYAK